MIINDQLITFRAYSAIFKMLKHVKIGPKMAKRINIFNKNKSKF